MALRFRPRHLQRTLLAHLRADLDGWITEPTNFGTRPITVLDYQPDEAGVQIEPNTLALTLGDWAAERPEQLGGGLASNDYAVFIDFYGASAAIALSVVADIHHLFTNAEFPLLDYSTDPPTETSEYIVCEDVVVERPLAALASSDFRRSWRVVKLTASVVHGGDA